MHNQNLNVFYIKTECKHNILLNADDYDFFKKQPLQPDVTPITPNLKKITDLQSDDLLIFYDNLIFESFIQLSKITNNYYHYDLLVAVKPSYNINNLFKMNFNIVNILSISRLFENDINYDFMKSIFNFDELLPYGFCDILAENHYNDFVCNAQFKLTQEYIEYKKWLKIQKDVNSLDELDLQRDKYDYGLKF
jgi:hypothetical protein